MSTVLEIVQTSHDYINVGELIVSKFSMQPTKTFVAEMACIQLLMDSAT